MEVGASEDGNTLGVSYPSLFEDALRNISLAFASAQEGAYRQALISLGWTPPEGES